MNKTELEANIAEKSGMTKKDAEKDMGALFESVQQTLI